MSANFYENDKYERLIDKLLDFRNSEIDTVISSNNKQIDYQLLERLKNRTDDLFKENRYKEFENARNIEARVRIHIFSQEDKKHSIRDFLIALIETVKHYEMNSREYLYRMLDTNVELLNDSLVREFLLLSSNIFNQFSGEDKLDIANCVSAFSDALQQYPKEQNYSIEIAIEAYYAAIKAYHELGQMEAWAIAYQNLAAAFRKRSQGNRIINIKRAIECYENALTVLTTEDFPLEWATIQLNLGIVHAVNSDGEVDNNLEIALSKYESALSIITPLKDPRLWSLLQANLGTTLLNRIKGSKVENIELSRNAYENALGELENADNWIPAPDEEYVLSEQARVYYGLGNTYLYRIEGDKASNIETAISYYKSALTLTDRDKNSKAWGETQSGIGLAYTERLNGQLEDNNNIAVSALSAALEELTRDYYPREWAIVQHNLGIAYRMLGGEENIYKAIEAFENAIEVYSTQRMRQKQVSSVNGLGNALVDSKDSANIEKAISLLEETLQYVPRDHFPRDWARLQNNLGSAYRRRIQGKQTLNYSNSIKAFENALKVFTPNSDPHSCLLAARNLAHTAHLSGDLEKALSTFEIAVAAIEKSIVEDMSDENRKKIQEQAIDVYEGIVEVCVGLGDLNQAVKYVELSKTQGLVKLISGQNVLDTVQMPEKVRNELRNIQRRIIFLRKNIELHENIGLLDEEINAQHVKFKNELEDAVAQFQSMLNKNIDPDSSLSFIAAVKYIDIDRVIAYSIKHSTAIVEWYITDRNFYVFVLSPGENKFEVISYSKSVYGKLIDFVTNYLKSYYYNHDAWRVNLEHYLVKLAGILELDNIVSLISDSVGSILLIPHRFLHMLPLSSLPTDTVGSAHLPDLFKEKVFMGPSLHLILLTSERNRPDLKSLIAVQNPSDDLPYTDIEVSAIKNNFHHKLILGGQQATYKNIVNSPLLSGGNVMHFACHGTYNVERPLESSLKLANDEKLTLVDIFGLPLDTYRLVVLSACETGFSDTSSLTDEYTGFGGGFLFGGAKCVLNTLWAIDDISSSILMIRFYELLAQEMNKEINISDISLAKILCETQRWLKSISGGEFVTWISSKIKDMEIDHTQRAHFEVKKKEWVQDPKPFSNPIYWASFTSIGN